MGFDPNKEDQMMARKRFKPEEIVAKLRQVSRSKLIEGRACAAETIQQAVALIGHPDANVYP